MDVRDLVGECFTFYFDILFRLVAKFLLAWKSGSLEVWKAGSLEVWKSGSLVEVTPMKVKCFACGQLQFIMNFLEKFHKESEMSSHLVGRNTFKTGLFQTE